MGAQSCCESKYLDLYIRSDAYWCTLAVPESGCELRSISRPYGPYRKHKSPHTAGSISTMYSTLQRCHSLVVLRRELVLLSYSRVKCRSISKVVPTGTHPFVAATTSSIAGALAAETPQPTQSSERRCCVSFHGIGGAHGRVLALSSLFPPWFLPQADALGGVVLSGRPCLPFWECGDCFPTSPALVMYRL